MPSSNFSFSFTRHFIMCKTPTMIRAADDREKKMVDLPTLVCKPTALAGNVAWWWKQLQHFFTFNNSLRVAWRRLSIDKPCVIVRHIHHQSHYTLNCHQNSLLERRRNGGKGKYSLCCDRNLFYSSAQGNFEVFFVIKTVSIRLPDSYSTWFFFTFLRFWHDDDDLGKRRESGFTLHRKTSA